MRSCQRMLCVEWRKKLSLPFYTYTTHLASRCLEHSEQSHIYSTVLHVNVRHRSKLARLLNEKDDLFLSAVQELSLSEVAHIVHDNIALINDKSTSDNDNEHHNSKVTCANHADNEKANTKEWQLKLLYEGLCAVNVILRVHYQAALDQNQDNSTASANDCVDNQCKNCCISLTLEERNDAVRVCEVVKKYMIENNSDKSIIPK